MKTMITKIEDAIKYIQEDMGVKEFEDMDKSARVAMKGFIEGTMEAKRDDYLVQAIREGVEDRRNGYYRRRLTTTLGDIVIKVPRTRKWSPAAPLKRYMVGLHGSMINSPAAVPVPHALAHVPEKISGCLVPVRNHRRNRDMVSSKMPCTHGVTLRSTAHHR